MDLRHTGSEDLLLVLQTKSLTITLKGPPSHPDYPGVHHDQKEATVRVKSREDFTLSLSGDAGTVSSSCTGKVFQGLFEGTPLFFEQQQYELFIEPNGNHSIAFWHENYALRKAVSPVGREGKMLSGILNFQNDIGYSDLVFLVDGQETVTITVEVFPSKISYKEDYKALVADVTAEVYNLVFDFLKRTYSSFDISPTVKASPVEFFSIIRKIYKDLIGATDLILRSPHHLLQKETEILPQHKVKQTGQETLKWLRKHPEEMCRKGQTIQVARAMTIRKYVTYDTRENRITKYMLEHTAHRLERFREMYRQMKSASEGNGPDEEILKEIDGMVRGIQRRCHTGFMKDVNASAAESGMSLVFGMAMGYRDLYRYYLLLQHGLAITGEMFSMSVKDMALLYEYWCFIKLNSLLKNNERYRLITQDVIRTNGTGLAVALVKGKASRVRYLDEKNGDGIVLSYNPTMLQMPTVNQRPDNVLSLTKRGGSTEYQYIFDAKYKMDPSIPGTYYHEKVCKLPGPKEEDINTMHRYRDAIVSENKGETLNRFNRSMVGAYVLFPFADEDQNYREHRFFKSIEKVNIGGLPFLPSQTQFVSEMLDELINDSTESVFERMSLPRGIEEKLQKVEWNKKDVMIGLLRDQRQLEICLEHGFYYVPARFVHDGNLPLRYVALFQAQYIFGKDAQIAYYGEVKQMQKVKRKEIVEIPCRSGTEEDNYYRMEIRKWEMLSRPIQVKERGIRFVTYTNEFLLRHAETSPELFLKNAEEYRFLTELKRYVNQTSFINETNEVPVGFIFGDHRVLFQDGKILLIHDRRIVAESAIRDFIRRPNAEFRGLMRGISKSTGM